MLDQISTKLAQNDQWVSGYKSYQQFDLKGHVGVIEVKKVNHVKNMKTSHMGQKFIFTKTASPHTTYIVWSRDLWL